MIYVIIGVYFVFFGCLVYRYDLFEREPWYAILFTAIVSGCMTYVFAWFVADPINEQLAWLGSERLVGSLTAGVCEELIKLAAVLITFAVMKHVFNDPFDGLIYGAFAGLGFAVYETLLYNSIDMATSLQNRAMHGFARFLIHCLLGSLTCAGLGFARFKTPNWKLTFVTLTVASMVLHFSYDYVVIGMMSSNVEKMAMQRVVLVLVMSMLMVLFGRAVVVGSKKSHTLHGKTSRRLFAWPFSLLVSRKKD